MFLREDREQCQLLLTKAFLGDRINRVRFLTGMEGFLIGGGIGGLSGLLGGSKSKKVKLPAQYYEAMNELLAKGKADVKYPTAGVAPLSELEQAGIGLGKEFIGSPVSPDVKFASQTYRDIAAPGDILDRPQVRGIISKATEEGDLMLNRLGRGMVTRGAFGSTPGRDILGRGVTSIQERIASALSEYLEGAESRRLTAAGGLERTGLAKETTQLKKIGTAVDLGALTRNIEQSIQNAKFQKLISDIEMKYKTQPATLASVMGQSVGTVTGGEPSQFAQAAPLIGSLLTAGIMSGSGGYGPGNWNVSPSMEGAQIIDKLMQTR